MKKNVIHFIKLINKTINGIKRGHTTYLVMFILYNICNMYSWGIKGFDKMPFYGVKLPELQVVWAGHGRILPLVKWGHFSCVLDTN